jgi:hypothetical protein
MRRITQIAVTITPEQRFRRAHSANEFGIAVRRTLQTANRADQLAPALASTTRVSAAEDGSSYE